MEGNLDKCLAFCQALVASNHRFTFALTIGKDNTFSFSTHDRAHNLKKAAPRLQSRRERRAVDPAVKQKATAYTAKVAAEKVAAEKVTAEKVAAEKVAAEKVAAEKVAAEKVAAEKVAAEKDAAEKAAGFNCDQCNFGSTSDQEMKQHKEITHASEQVAADAAAEQAAAGASPLALVLPALVPSASTPLALVPSASVPSASLLPMPLGLVAAVDPSATNARQATKQAEEELSSLTKPKLIMLCKERRLPHSGNKAALLERLGSPEKLRGPSTEDSAAKVSPGKDSREEEPATPAKVCWVCRTCSPENPGGGRCKWSNAWAKK